MKIRFQTRIVGGTTTPVNGNPSAAALIDRRTGARCGASLIDSQWFITAAHCIEQGDVPNYVFRVGDNGLRTRKHSLPFAIVFVFLNPKLNIRNISTIFPSVRITFLRRLSTSILQSPWRVCNGIYSFLRKIQTFRILYFVCPATDTMPKRVQMTSQFVKRIMWDIMKALVSCGEVFSFCIDIRWSTLFSTFKVQFVCHGVLEQLITLAQLQRVNEFENIS